MLSRAPPNMKLLSALYTLLAIGSCFVHVTACIDTTENDQDCDQDYKCGQDWTYDPIDQTCYRLYSDKASWTASQEQCQSDGANLASILNEGQQGILQSVLMENRTEDSWIGANSLKADEEWEWSDGSPFSYTSWSYDQPSKLEDAKCVSTLRWDSYRWKNDLCDKEKNFICKKQASGAATQPTVPPTREPCQETGVTEVVCLFESFPKYALYGHNDKVLRGMSVSKCRKACLNETEFECLSFDFSTRSQSCYLSASNRETVPADDFSAHGESIYFEKLCTEVDTCYLEPVSCTVDLQAWGIKDDKSQRKGYIKVNGQTIIETNWLSDNIDKVLPGIYIVGLDLESCATSNLRYFAHYQMYELSNFIRNSVPFDGLVLWMSAGDLKWDLRHHLTEFGLQVRDLQPMGKFAGVTQKGNLESGQTVVGAVCIRGDNVQATVKIEGSILNLEDITTTILAESGNMIGAD